MSETQVFPIQTDNDVVSARLQARQAARAAGLPIIDQARFSMTASSLAHSLQLDKYYPGQISISQMNGAHGNGLMLTCTIFGVSDPTSLTADLKKSEWRQMVDDLKVSVLPNGDLQVAALKWIG